MPCCCCCCCCCRDYAEYKCGGGASSGPNVGGGGHSGSCFSCLRCCCCWAPGHFSNNRTGPGDSHGDIADGPVLLQQDNLVLHNEFGAPRVDAALYKDSLKLQVVPSSCSGSRIVTQIIPLRRIVGCQLLKVESNCLFYSKSLKPVRRVGGKDDDVEADQPDEGHGKKSPSAFFNLTCYEEKRAGEEDEIKYRMVEYVFKVDTQPSSRANQELALKWVERIGAKLHRLHQQIPASRRWDKAKKLLIFVNPQSGQGRAPGIFKYFVEPLLNQANIFYDVVVTKRANHGRDVVANEDLSRWSGLVILSGDGLLYEVLQGLFSREDFEEARQMPISIIPGGSGNGLARTLVFEQEQKYEDLATLPTMVNLLAGRTRSLDLVCLQTMSGKSVYSFLSLGWGFLADVDIESETLRFMGEFRFTLWSLWRLAWFRTYRGRLSYCPAGEGAGNSNAAQGDQSKGAAEEETTAQEDYPSFQQRLAAAAEAKWVPARDYEEPAVPRPARLPPPARLTAPPLSDPVPPHWTVVEDDFVLVYLLNAAYIGSDVKIVPRAKVADGKLWLLIVRKGVSKWNFLRFLLSLEDGSHLDVPGVELVEVSALRIEPLDERGFINVDGELLEYEPVQAQVLPALVRVT